MSVSSRCMQDNADDPFCEGRSYTRSSILHIGRELVHALRTLHGAGYVHNDLKPMNLIFGANASGREDHVHLIDFGMVSNVGDDTVTRSSEVHYGGGTPMFASLAALEGRPTRPVDDIEMLWYLLAFLSQGTQMQQGNLPWQWGEHCTQRTPVSSL